MDHLIKVHGGWYTGGGGLGYDFDDDQGYEDDAWWERDEIDIIFWDTAHLSSVDLHIFFTAGLLLAVVGFIKGFHVSAKR
jgi:hypothetical protein